MMDEHGFDLWADGYDQSVGLSDEEITYPFAGYKQVLGTIFREVMKRGGGDILDVGFGTGVLTARLYEQGCRIWGQDFSPRMVEITQQKLPQAQLYCGSFAEGLVPALKRQTYDAVIATYSLHHLSDEQKAEFVRELKAQLRPGGVLLIGDVAFENRAALEACREEAGDEWDADEIYFVADEWQQLTGEKVLFDKLSHCAGVLTMERRPFSMSRMHEIQTELQTKYFDKWGGVSPERSVRILLWMMGEAGEVADIIKKKGERAIMDDPAVRHDFVEEMCDVLMYFNDLMLCYGITPEELEEIYEAKHRRNMKRW